MVLYVTKSIGRIIIDPIFWVIAGTVVYLYKRELEKIQKPKPLRYYLADSLGHTFCGLSVGLIIGGTLSYFGIISILDIKVLVLIPIALFLTTLNPRFGCFSYCIPFAYMIEGIIKLFGGKLLELPYRHLILLVGLLHIIEGILVILIGHTKAIPLPVYEEGKLNINYILRHIWVVPIMIVTKETYFFVPLYTLLAYGDYVRGHTIKRQTYTTGGWILMYGLFVLGLVFCHTYGYLPIGGIVILMPVGHEMIFIMSHKEVYLKKAHKKL